ncbi:2629_t:CDS:2 [Ambispora gerdemannii]|uniref:2629_t:CDS:1 n=1 Tax=Ambispora gerdemannii TaxID=144530 RepID=A0A9N8VTI6_9GLOM|nr:2629_t:CDS:2 [Ambispora gerdemannii]
MSLNIGPEIPEHLLKKPQTDSDEQEVSDNEQEVSDNEQEVSDNEQEDSNEHLSSKSKSSNLDPIESEDIRDQDDPDSYMPALPPDLLEERAKRKRNLKSEARDLNVSVDGDESLNKKSSRRVVGPAAPPPPEFLANLQNGEVEEEEDIIGPVLPKGFSDEINDEIEMQTKIHEFEQRAEKMRRELRPDDSDSEKKTERGEWMIVPPKAGFLGESPTNMRSRQFNKKEYDPSKVDNSLWTETPAERIERIKNSSQKRKHVKVDDDEPIKYSKEELETAESIKEYNAMHRPVSLLEQHSETYVKSKKWEKDDVRQRPFDRDRDVLGPRRMDSRKRREIVDQAKGLGSKFGHGRSGTFL